jgi:adenylosuccinate lyase
MEYFKQKIVAGEVGSSAMPHKVNPSLGASVFGPKDGGKLRGFTLGILRKVQGKQGKTREKWEVPWEILRKKTCKTYGNQESGKNWKCHNVFGFKMGIETGTIMDN